MVRNDNSFCWQIEAAGIEARYWFRKGATNQQLTGWFAGVFGSGGTYDFQLKKREGTQGDFYFIGGLTGGYALPIGKNFNLEFSVGVGHVTTNYRNYTVVENELIKKGSAMRYQSILPAKAKFSLVWLLHKNERGGRK